MGGRERHSSGTASRGGRSEGMSWLEGWEAEERRVRKLRKKRRWIYTPLLLFLSLLMLNFSSPLAVAVALLTGSIVTNITTNQILHYRKTSNLSKPFLP